MSGQVSSLLPSLPPCRVRWKVCDLCGVCSHHCGVPAVGDDAVRGAIPYRVSEKSLNTMRTLHLPLTISQSLPPSLPPSLPFSHLV